MQVPLVIQEWQEQARVEERVKTTARDILRFLELHFPPGAPDDLAEAVRLTTDPARLTEWLDAAYTAATLADFRQAVLPRGAAPRKRRPRP